MEAERLWAGGDGLQGNKFKAKKERRWLPALKRGEAELFGFGNPTGAEFASDGERSRRARGLCTLG